MRKKADSNVPFFLVFILLALVFMFFGFPLIKNAFTKLWGGVSVADQSLTKSLLQKCLDKGDKGLHDYDKDGMPDFCDNCPLQANSPEKMWVELCCGNTGKREFLSIAANGYVDGNFKTVNKKENYCKNPVGKDLKSLPGYSPNWNEEYATS
jgi:hypothetical protein